MRRRIRILVVSILTAGTVFSATPVKAYTGFCLDTDVFEAFFINLLADPPFHVEAALFGDDPDC